VQEELAAETNAGTTETKASTVLNENMMMLNVKGEERVEDG